MQIYCTFYLANNFFANVGLVLVDCALGWNLEELKFKSYIEYPIQ